MRVSVRRIELISRQSALTAGVIDPTKVARIALINAASVAALMLTTEAMIAERPSVHQHEQSGGMGGMGM